MNYRLYSFINNLYMSPIQWGIQTAHCVSNLSLYKHNTPQYEMYHDWALNSPTIIICQGSNVAGLTAIKDQLGPLCAQLELPWTYFHEDQESLGGVLTSVAVLVPEELFSCQIVEFDRVTRQPRFKRPVPEGEVNPEDIRYYTFSDEEYAFLSLVKTARLA